MLLRTTKDEVERISDAKTSKLSNYQNKFISNTINNLTCARVAITKFPRFLYLNIVFFPPGPPTPCTVVLYHIVSFQTTVSKRMKKQQILILVFFHPYIVFSFFFLSLSLQKTRRQILIQVIGGELQERLIPVPYSKNSTDQAVRAKNKLNFFKQKKVLPFLSFRVFLSSSSLSS